MSVPPAVHIGVQFAQSVVQPLTSTNADRRLTKEWPPPGATV